MHEVVARPTVVWLVDDDPGEHLLFTLAFRPYQAQVTLVHLQSAQEVLARVQGGGRPDLLLVDVYMPGGGAPHILAELSRIGHSHDAFLAISSAPNAALVKECTDLGASAVLEKPHDMDTLRDWANGIARKGVTALL